MPISSTPPGGIFDDAKLPQLARSYLASAYDNALAEHGIRTGGTISTQQLLDTLASAGDLYNEAILAAIAELSSVLDQVTKAKEALIARAMDPGLKINRDVLARAAGFKHRSRLHQIVNEMRQGPFLADETIPVEGKIRDGNHRLHAMLEDGEA
jgi:hypothetical protein